MNTIDLLQEALSLLGYYVVENHCNPISNFQSAAKKGNISRPTAYKRIKKALAGGMEVALRDAYHFLKGSGYYE